MKTYRLFGAALLALSVFATACDDDDDPSSPPAATQFTASLSGGAERPAITSTGTGTATFTVNADGTIAYTVKVNNLTSRVTNCHIHLARPDISGGVLVTLCDAATLPTTPITTETTIASGTIVEGANTSTKGSTPTTLAALRKLLESGTTYVNVHTANNTGGEIRGNITVVP